MANEQTSVPLYAASEVLTAANMNISAGTGVPVFATTVTRDAAFGGASEKVLAEGQLCYLSSTNVVQYYDGASWATVGPAAASGLTLINATTAGTTVSSVAISNVFSATYDAYLVSISGGVSSSATMGFRLTLGATVTGYYYAYNEVTYAGVIGSPNVGANVAFCDIGYGSSTGAGVSCDIFNPFLAKKSVFLPKALTLPSTTGYADTGGGFLNDTTSYTGFTITPSVGTITGHVIRTYGYQNS